MPRRLIRTKKGLEKCNSGFSEPKKRLNLNLPRQICRLINYLPRSLRRLPFFQPKKGSFRTENLICDSKSAFFVDSYQKSNLLTRINQIRVEKNKKKFVKILRFFLWRPKLSSLLIPFWAKNVNISPFLRVPSSSQAHWLPLQRWRTITVSQRGHVRWLKKGLFARFRSANLTLCKNP